MSDKPLYLELTILVIAIRFLCVTYLDVLQPAFDHGAEQLRFMDCGSFLLILKSNALIDEHWWIQDKKNILRPETVMDRSLTKWKFEIHEAILQKSRNF